MPHVSSDQPSMAAGELTPRMHARSDVNRYAIGLAKMRNMTVMPQGGGTRRVGVRMVAEVKDSTKAAKLKPFRFSTDQTYQMEFGENYIRFYRNGGQVTISSVGISNCADNGSGLIRVTTSANHNVSTGTRLPISGVTGTAEANGIWVITKVDDTNFDLVGSTFSNAYVSGGQIDAAPYELDTPYTEADLADVNIAQSADLIYLGCAGTADKNKPRKLSRFGHTQWTLEVVPFKDGPWLPKNKTETTLSFSTGTKDASATVTASAEDGINNGEGFKSTDVGRLIRLEHSKDFGYAEITAFTDSLTVTVTNKTAIPTITAKDTWRLGAFSETTGYPAFPLFHGPRLWWFNTESEPNRSWASEIDSFESHAPTADDGAGDKLAVLTENSINKVISSQNPIRWAVSGPTLQLGTSGQEYQIKAQSLDEPLGPSSADDDSQTNIGGAAIDPIRAWGATLFVSRSQRKLMEYVYSFEQDSFVARDRAILSEHFLREGNGVVEMAWAQEPDAIAWMCLGDGSLVGMTYVRDQEMYGFHKHPIGGNAKIESVSVIPAPDESYDQVWVIGHFADIDGSEKRYVGYIEQPFDPADEDDKADMFFVDFGLSYDGAATTTITGLEHLEGLEVAAVADGVATPNKTVSSGQIELDVAASKVHVGLPYTPVVKTLPIDAGNPSGSARTKTKRVDHVTISFYNSIGVSLGETEAEATEEEFRRHSPPSNDNEAPKLFTGDIKFSLDQGYETEGNFVIKQEKPYPLTVLGISPQLRVTER